MTKISNPVPIFLDGRGEALDGGYVYIGEAGQNPVNFPIDLFWDVARTIPAAQPIRTLGGLLVNGATPSYVFAAEGDYSQAVFDVNMNPVGNVILSIAAAAVSYQPLDSDLTAIAALSTTPYGRSLLTLANTAALRTATGIPDPLPAIGGTVSGDILRTSAGAHLWHVTPGFFGRVFVSPLADGDPTGVPGDIWFAT